MVNETLIWLIPLPPALAFVLIVLFTNRSKGLSHTLAVGGAGLSWLAAMIIFVRAITTPALSQNPFTSSIAWFPTGTVNFDIGVLIDPLSAMAIFFVAWTVLMIFIYSIGYHNYGQPAGKHDKPGLPPEGAEIKDKKGHVQKVPSVEPMYSRFFALISLFAFAMYLLVISDNLLTLYIGWEIMGLCSYLLIGFWYAKDSARKAAIKAFLTTRVGDVFMLLGLAALYSLTGTLNFQAILGNQQVLNQLAAAASPISGLSWAGLIGLLLFIGTVGKSAQFPLHIWLPDAMEGPTPVSAMIHAATMVSAGVYLVIRFFPLLSVGWEPGGASTPPMMAMAFIGAFTALFAATIALAQNDIKRVLAYSTISQLGYMIAALGVGAYAAAAFHLFTHAFFKALLFLGSGSVIHGMEHGVLHTGEHVDPQDMLNMGGLAKKMPVTFWTFAAGGLALSGFPLITAGFWSKDAIIASAFENGHFFVFVTLALAALLTAFYTARQITLTFLGKPRSKAAEHASESRPVMLFPLVVLAVVAIGGGWFGIPHTFPGLGGLVPDWIGDFLNSMISNSITEEVASLVPLFTSLVVALGGLFLGWWIYRDTRENVDPLEKPLGGVHTLLKNKYYFDEFYGLVLYRPANWLAETFTYLWLDKGLIDGILHGIAKIGLWLGGVVRNVIDLPVINGAGDAMADGTRELGGGLRKLQTGKIQTYMLIAMGALAVVAFIFVFVINFHG
jgi:NADH-quinone oxidoreductase subunit L